jgi:hypothetical protein
MAAEMAQMAARRGWHRGERVPAGELVYFRVAVHQSGIQELEDVVLAASIQHLYIMASTFPQGRLSWMCNWPPVMDVLHPLLLRGRDSSMLGATLAVKLVSS